MAGLVDLITLISSSTRAADVASVSSSKTTMLGFIRTTLYHRSQDRRACCLVLNSIAQHELREALTLYRSCAPGAAPQRRARRPSSSERGAADVVAGEVAVAAAVVVAEAA